MKKNNTATAQMNDSRISGITVLLTADSPPYEQRSWEDKTSGQRRSRVEIIVEDFSFIGGESGGRSGGSAPRAAKADASDASGADFVPDDMPADEAINLDDIPF